MKKIVVILLICIIIIFLSIVTIHKFKSNSTINTETTINKSKTKFVEYVANKVNAKDKTNQVKDINAYKDSVINDIITSVNYIVYDSNKSIYGKIFIDKAGLHITDENENDLVNLSNLHFKTMYKKEIDYNDGIFIYLITEEGGTYMLKFDNNNIRNTTLDVMPTKYKVTNFVDIDFKLDMPPSLNTVFVLEEDGNIYDLFSGLRYDENIIGLYNKFYVFDDNSLSNIYGYMYEKNYSNYKVKYAFKVCEENDFIENDSVIIITENDELFYVKNNEFWSYYMYYKKVKNVSIDAKYPFVKSNLKLTFDDNETINLKATCSTYFCPVVLE